MTCRKAGSSITKRSSPDRQGAQPLTPGRSGTVQTLLRMSTISSKPTSGMATTISFTPGCALAPELEPTAPALMGEPPRGRFDLCEVPAYHQRIKLTRPHVG